MLTAADFISPRGPLTDAMFPGEDLEELAAAWLAQAQAATNLERAQQAYVLMRAYGTVLDRVMLQASSERKGDASASRSDAQLAHWRRERDRHARAYATLTGSVASENRPVKAVW